MRVCRLLPIGLVFACLGLIAAPPQRDVSPREARRIGEERQKDARGRAKRAQREGRRNQKQVAREIKRRDKQRRREAEQLTKDRRKQGEQVKARAGQPQQPAAPPKADGPSKSQPSPIERLRGYSGIEPKEQ